MARVETAESPEFPALFTELLDLFPQSDETRDEDPRHGAAVKFLIGHWLARNPDAVIDFAQHSKYEGDLWSTAGDILGQAWPEKAISLIDQKGIEALPENFISSALTKISNQYPELYMKFDPQGARNDRLTGQWCAAVKALAARDPAAAASAWLLWKPSEYHAPDYDSLPEIVTSWRKKDPAAARAWAENLADTDCRSIALHSWLTGLARESPAAALKELSGLNLGSAMKYSWGFDGSEPAYEPDARLAVARELAKRDLVSALAASGELAGAFHGDDDEERASSLVLVRQWMARSCLAALPDDPASFMSGLAAISEAAASLDGSRDWWTNLQKTYLPERIAAWSFEDCMTAARMNAAGDRDLLRVLLQRAVDTNPDQALAATQDLPPEAAVQMTKLLFQASDWPGADPASRLELLAAIPASAWDDEITHSLRGDEELFAPVLAARAGVELENVYEEFAGSWAEEDPEAAAAWTAGLPGYPGRLAAGRVAALWAGQDEAAASAWVASLPPGLGRDRAAAELVRALAPADPESAWTWARSIQSDWDRAEALTEVSNSFDGKIPEALTKERKSAVEAALSDWLEPPLISDETL